MSGRCFTIGALLSATVVLSACSTDGFYEAVGLAKSAPDESLVTTTQPLALPPDFSLPPPTEPRQITDAEPAPAPEAAPTTPVQTASVSQPTQITAGAAAAPGAAPGEPVISRVNPDGTPKTARQIHDEALAKKAEIRKAQNESYGTWRNLWNVIWN